MNTKLNYPILGYLTFEATPIGMQTIVFGTAKKPFIQDIDKQGNVQGFLPLRPLARHEYVEMPIPTAPQTGQPHLCAFVMGRHDPSMLMAAWTDMPSHVLKAYPTMRKEFLNYPVAGHRLANFVSGQVSRYSAANNYPPDFGTGGYEFELSRLQIDDAHYFQVAPEVRLLAREAGHVPKGPSDHTPTP